jgi:GGDEF domain-containing protein
VVVDGIVAPLGVSVGLDVAGSEAPVGPRLDPADAALDAAKRDGRGCWRST